MYNVGQIIYVFKQKNKIFPCMVCEEVVTKTLNGETKTYAVLLPDSENTKVYLSKLKDVKIFETLDDFKRYFTNLANNRVESLISDCKKHESANFSNIKPIGNTKVEIKEAVLGTDFLTEDNVRLNIDLDSFSNIKGLDNVS